MPWFRTVGPGARGRLVKAGKGYQERAPYREAIAGLSGDRLVELELDEGETLRQVRVRLRRAAKEVGREVQYGETEQGTLLVWLAERPRRPRRRTSGRAQEGSALAAPQEELPP